MVIYYACFPILCRSLSRKLISQWSEGNEHVQVLAFLVLRRLTLLHPHPSLHTTLKASILATSADCSGYELDSVYVVMFSVHFLLIAYLQIPDFPTCAPIFTAVHQLI